MALWILTVNWDAGLAPLVYREEPLNPQERLWKAKLTKTQPHTARPGFTSDSSSTPCNGAERCLSSHFFHWHPLPPPHHCPPLHSTLEPGVVERKQAWPPNDLGFKSCSASRHISTLGELVLCLMASASASSSVKWAVMRSHSCHHSVIQQTLREHWLVAWREPVICGMPWG